MRIILPYVPCYLWVSMGPFEDWGDLIKQVTSQVQGLLEAPMKGEAPILAPRLHTVAEAQLATNHPPWVSRALFMPLAFLRLQTPHVNATRM